MHNLSALAVALHAVAAVLWVGGMFFAYVILRPSVSDYAAPQRLVLWNRVFDRFFPWAWAAVIVLPATGYGTVFLDFGGFDNAGLHIHLMQGFGLVMIALFFYLYTIVYPQYRRLVGAETWPEAAKQLATIRRIVGTNTVLGFLTVAIGASGRFWI